MSHLCAGIFGFPRPTKEPFKTELISKNEEVSTASNGNDDEQPTPKALDKKSDTQSNNITATQDQFNSFIDIPTEGYIIPTLIPTTCESCCDEANMVQILCCPTEVMNSIHLPFKIGYNIFYPQSTDTTQSADATQLTNITQPTDTTQSTNSIQSTQSSCCNSIDLPKTMDTGSVTPKITITSRAPTSMSIDSLKESLSCMENSNHLSVTDNRSIERAAVNIGAITNNAGNQCKNVRSNVASNNLSTTNSGETTFLCEKCAKNCQGTVERASLNAGTANKTTRVINANESSTQNIPTKHTDSVNVESFSEACSNGTIRANTATKSSTDESNTFTKSTVINKDQNTAAVFNVTTSETSIGSQNKQSKCFKKNTAVDKETEPTTAAKRKEYTRSTETPVELLSTNKCKNVCESVESITDKPKSACSSIKNEEKSIESLNQSTTAISTKANSGATTLTNTETEFSKSDNTTSTCSRYLNSVMNGVEGLQLLKIGSLTSFGCFYDSRICAEIERITDDAWKKSDCKREPTKTKRYTLF